MMADLTLTVHGNTASGHMDFAARAKAPDYYNLFTSIVMDIHRCN
jgi:hypothetical protein